MQILRRVGHFNIRSEAKPRSPGTHVTPILAEVARKLGHLKKAEEEEDLDLLLLKYRNWQVGDIGVFNRIALGLAWEDWLSRQVEDLVYHFGEVEIDGISGTPDGVIWAAGRSKVYESKVTWKSANQERRPFHKEWLWIKQVQAYCYMLGETQAQLHAFYVNGEYQGDGPLYVIYEMEFTREELEGCWRIVQTHRHLIEESAA